MEAKEWTSNDGSYIVDPQITIRFKELLNNADIESYKSEKSDPFWQDLLNILAQCLIHEETHLPKHDEIIFKREPGSKTVSPVSHVILQYQTSDITVRTLSLWVLLQHNANSFINRLKKALISSGIKKDDKTKRLAVIRFSLPPSGKATENNVSEFTQKGGITLCPSGSDIATLTAIKTISIEFPQTWPNWAQSDLPTTSLSFIKEHLNWLRGKKP
jgi:hypothetical protein